MSAFKVRAGKASKNKVRVVIPDSHGNHIDKVAEAALLQDLKRLDPDEVVGLGDHLDCAGVFSSHAKAYTNEMAETYEDDYLAANAFLDAGQKASPRALWRLLEGNHEQRVERWAASTFPSQKDAESLLDRFGPEAVLQLKKRGIPYFKRSVCYMGLSIPGTIKLGKCHFVHGIGHSQNAAQVHLQRFGASVVFGHIHRAMSVIGRTVSSDGQGAWCPGTLAKLQPLYMHTAPTNWSHGFLVQFINPSGRFLTLHVPICKGFSLLDVVAQRLA